MSQDAPSSRKVKKAQRDAERLRTGKKRKRDEDDEHRVESEQQMPEKDLASLDAGTEALELDAVTLETSKKVAPKRKAEIAADSLNTARAFKVSEGADGIAPAPKKQKKDAPASMKIGEAGEDVAAADKAGKSRFILFIGNLPYTATDESIQAHFKKLTPFHLRHRTDPKTKQSKGFAFLEFENYDRMKTCLKLYHHSMFDAATKVEAGAEQANQPKKKDKGARRINVELTAGGGGKAEGRKEKIKVKNVRLEEQRKRRAEQEMKEKVKKEKKRVTGSNATVPLEKEVEEVKPAVGAEETAGMHPSRLARLKG